MLSWIESTLYKDPQTKPALQRCPRCGGNLYGRDTSCIRCERRGKMTLSEISACYEEAAVPLRRRLHELREALKTAADPEEIWHLQRRIAELTPMLTEMNELAELTAHYYDRGYCRSAKYTL